ncbi:hypothetical protein VP01_142g16 [Puccinia sorghi]|uniref:Uncharacterized protein n=1 Tax=Puccinia sorghi TaxID=27349 RepID=A0A0L6VKF3_9BASI|nr:hypothetical protein VP01_142g16 [Puccinia sorghi]
MDFSTLVLISITLAISGMNTSNVSATPIPQLFYPNGFNRPIYPPPGNFPLPGVYPVNNQFNGRPIFYRRQATPMSSGSAMTHTPGTAATQPAMSTNQVTVLSTGAAATHSMSQNMTGQTPSKPMTTTAYLMMPETAESTSKVSKPTAGTMTAMPIRGIAPMMQNMAANVSHTMPSASSPAAMNHTMASQTSPSAAPASSTTIMMLTQPMEAAAKTMRRRQIALSPSTSTSTTVPATMTMANNGVGSTPPLPTGQGQMTNGQPRMMAGTTTTVPTQIAGMMSHPTGQMSGMVNGESQPLVMTTSSKLAVTRRGEVTLSSSTGTPALVIPHVSTPNMTAFTPQMMAGQAPTAPITASATTEPMQMRSPAPMSMPPMAPAKTVARRELLSSSILGSNMNMHNLSTSPASPCAPATVNYTPSQNVSPTTGLPTTNLALTPTSSYGTTRTNPATTNTPSMAASGLAAPLTGSTVGQTAYTPASNQPPFVSTASTASTAVPTISISYLPTSSNPAAVNPTTNSAPNPAVYDSSARTPIPINKPMELDTQSS